MSKLTIPYDDEEEVDKVERKSKRKGDFRDQVVKGVEAMGVISISHDLFSHYPFHTIHFTLYSFLKGCI